jgi:hypothetical protein
VEEISKVQRSSEDGWTTRTIIIPAQEQKSTRRSW